MPVFLEVVVEPPGAPDGLKRGQRWSLPSDREVRLGIPACPDVVIVRPTGDGHVLVHTGRDHGRAVPVELSGELVPRGGQVPLRNGDRIAIADGGVWRYVFSGRRVFSTPVLGFADWLLFSPGAAFALAPADRVAWRAVPRSSPSAPPLQLRFVRAGPGQQEQQEALQRAGDVDDEAAQHVKGTLFDSRRSALLFDDVAGVTVQDILARTREQSAAVDTSLAVALLTPAVRCLATVDLPAESGPSNIVVSVDGTVRFTGFVDAAAAPAPAERPSAAAVAQLIMDVLAEEDDDPDHPELGRDIASSFFDDSTVTPQDLWRSLQQWSARLTPATPQQLASLVRGLFPEVVEAERALRDELSILDASLVDELLKT